MNDRIKCVIVLTFSNHTNRIKLTVTLSQTNFAIFATFKLSSANTLSLNILLFGYELLSNLLYLQHRIYTAF